MFGRLWLAASMPGDIDILGLRLTKQKWANPHTEQSPWLQHPRRTSHRHFQRLIMGTLDGLDMI